MKEGIKLDELERLHSNGPWPSERPSERLVPLRKDTSRRRRWYVPAGSRDLSNSTLSFYAVKRVNKSDDHPVVRRILALQATFI